MTTASLWDQAVAELSEEDMRIFRVGNAEPSQILGEILTVVNSQRDRSQLNKWKILGRGGQEIIMSDVCAKISACVHKFMSVIDIATSFDPVHTALPWAGVRFILQLCLNSSDTFQAIVEGLEKASSVIARCSIVEALYLHGSQSDAGKAFETDLRKLYGTVLHFLCKAKNYYHHKRLKPILNLTYKPLLEDAVKAMENAEHNFQIQKGIFDGEKLKNINDGVDGLQVTQNRLETTLKELEDLVFRTMGQTSDIYDALKETERSALLNWLSPIRVQDHYKSAMKSLLQNSGDWLLANPSFTSWRDSSSSEMIWLHGIPGCGKTKLTTVVIKHLRDYGSRVLSRPAPIAHFYCSRDPAEPERSDAREILRSLAKQLSLNVDEESLRRPTMDEYQKRRHEAQHDGESPGTLTVEDCVQLICELGRTTPATIIIDALDECDSFQRTLIITALDDISSKSGDIVKIFVSSRDEKDIKACFTKEKMIQITDKTNAVDLERFIKEQVDRFIKRWSAIHGKSIESLQQLRDEIVCALITGAQGMFLWVILQLNNIGDTERIKSEDDIRPTLSSLPSTLSKSYEVIHNRIQSMGEAAKTVAVQALQWLLYSQRMLSVSEFVAAVSRNSEKSVEISSDAILDYCCNLVVLDKEANSFRLVHSTVREYLESLESYSAKEAHFSITYRCLGTFLWGTCGKDILSSYATRYWLAHLEKLCESPHRVGIKPFLVEFFTQEEHFEDWLENLEELPTEENFSWSNSLERKLDASFSTPPSPLFAICSFGLIEVLEDPEIYNVLDWTHRNKHGTSGLYLAARWGHARLVVELLNRGVDVNSPGHQYGTALQAASFAGHEDIVKILLDRDASFSDSGEFSSPLQAALANNHESIAQTILDRGIPFKTQKQFKDALQTATFQGNVTIIHQLLNVAPKSFTPKETPNLLQVALFSRKKRQVKKLMEDCSDINKVSGQFGTALQAAIAGGSYELVQIVIDSGAKLDVRGSLGYPLRGAVVANKIDIVKCLLEKGADANTEDDELGDALQAAASKGYSDIMLLLLAYHADVNGRGGFFKNALQAAAFRGHELAVRLLLDHGAKLDDRWGKCTGRYRDALQAAVYAGNQNIVEILLENGAKINPGRIDRTYPCSFGFESNRIALPGVRKEIRQFDIPEELNPLEIAARHGNVGLMKMLLDKGAAIDAKDANRRDKEFHDGCAYTALQIAAYWGHISAITYLLDNGADINAVRQTLGTPLQASLEGLQFHVAKLLLARGAEIDKHWMVFGSCLQVFSERGSMEVVKFLLEYGANIEDRGGENGNALQVACDAGHIDIIRFLLSKGADANAPGGGNGSALQASAAKGHASIVELLILNGARVDDAKSGTESALHVATANGHEQVVCLLLKSLANVKPMMDLGSDEMDLNDYQRFHKKTRIFGPPLHLAAWYGYEKIVSLLLQNGASIHQISKLPIQHIHARQELSYVRRSGNALVAACVGGHISIVRLLFLQDPWSYLQYKTFGPALEAGIAFEREEVITLLIEEGVRVGFQPEHFDSSVDFACQRDYFQFMNQIFKHFSQTDWSAALLQATPAGSTDIVAALTKKGANVNWVNEKGESALALVVKETKNYRRRWSYNSPKLIEAVQILIETGASLDNSPNWTDYLPYVISKVGNVGAFEAIERHGHILFPDASKFSEALLYASQEGRVDMVRYLSRKGTLTVENIEAAIWAAITEIKRDNGQVEVIKILLSLDVKLCFTKDGPLILASMKGLTEIVKLLLSYEYYNTTDPERCLFIAVFQSDVECARAILEFLHDHIDKLQICKQQLIICIRQLIPFCLPSCATERLQYSFFLNRKAKCVPIHNIYDTATKMLEYLFSFGIHPDTCHLDGESILYIAAKKGADKEVKVLLQHGADCNLKTGEHGSSLVATAIHGSAKVTKLLLDAGAYINAQSTQYGTPLIAIMAQKWGSCYAEMGHTDSSTHGCHSCCAKVLLEYGADIDAQGGSFGTALQAAKKVGNEKGVKMLLEWGACLDL